MLKSLIPFLERPPLYTKTTIPFWDDEHISMGDFGVKRAILHLTVAIGIQRM
ncbi:MAG: hypothetical protein ACK5H4_13640 [Lacrimispora sphenoides]